jgi:hypothetical protein
MVYAASVSSNQAAVKANAAPGHGAYRGRSRLQAWYLGTSRQPRTQRPGIGDETFERISGRSEVV